MNDLNFLEKRLEDEHFELLARIDNNYLYKFLAEKIELCNPAKVHILTNLDEDKSFIRNAAKRNYEEACLAIKGHTIHFDGYNDLSRDKGSTKILVPDDVVLDQDINTGNREDCILEITDILRNIMKDRELFVKFYCLGPVGSLFSILCVQLTDSSYVIHNEDLLYRNGYEEFIRKGNSQNFFKFVHSQGETIEAGLGLQVSKNKDKKRIYIDINDQTIYSVNTQYGGNTIGLKKLAMRLAINRASNEGWLTEHMAIFGIKGPNNRFSYFTGAFPSMCGKTSTAMLDGETIVGDDIAYIRKIDNKIRAVNVERGIFGIIDGINSIDDPLQWKVLTKPGEVIFSNVLVDKELNVFWSGMGKQIPIEGVNHSGNWKIGKIDGSGKEISPSEKNARFTFSLDHLDNLDPLIEDKNGVEISGIIYGSRDTECWVPVEESFSWEHGIITKGASIESETTAATIGREGIKVFNPMSNIDFLSIPIGRYIDNNLKIAKGLSHPPRIFSVNYFLKGPDGTFLNHKNDKHVWLKWMELRVHDEINALKAPTGFIPVFEDLEKLFGSVLNKEYSKDDYINQFSIRVGQNIAKIDRIISIYKNRVKDAPGILFDILKEQKIRLEDSSLKYGNNISPFTLGE